MNRRTHVCLTCRRSYRRDRDVAKFPCPACKRPCERVHAKLRIPSPKREKEWKRFWRIYREEKRQLARFQGDPNVKRIDLKLLSQIWTRE